MIFVCFPIHINCRWSQTFYLIFCCSETQTYSKIMVWIFAPLSYSFLHLISVSTPLTCRWVDPAALHLWKRFDLDPASGAFRAEILLSAPSFSPAQFPQLWSKTSSALLLYFIHYGATRSRFNPVKGAQPPSGICSPTGARKQSIRWPKDEHRKWQRACFYLMGTCWELISILLQIRPPAASCTQKHATVELCLDKYQINAIM